MRLFRRHFLLIAVAALPLLGLPQAGQAAPSAEAAEKVVTDLVNQMWAILSQKDAAEQERVQQLAAAIDRATDTELLGRLALGRHWRTLSDDQKQRYEEHFPGFITHLLASRLIGAAGDVEGRLEDTFSLVESQPTGKEDIVVRSELQREGGQPVLVDWRLRESGDRLAIIDLAIDQVSLLVSQRSEFASVIERGSVDDLLTELEG